MNIQANPGGASPCPLPVGQWRQVRVPLLSKSSHPLEVTLTVSNIGWARSMFVGGSLRPCLQVDFQSKPFDPFFLLLLLFHLVLVPAIWIGCHKVAEEHQNPFVLDAPSLLCLYPNLHKHKLDLTSNASGYKNDRQKLYAPTCRLYLDLDVLFLIKLISFLSQQKPVRHPQFSLNTSDCLLFVLLGLPLLHFSLLEVKRSQSWFFLASHFSCLLSLLEWWSEQGALPKTSSCHRVVALS